jgi:hypothetical protein
MPPHAAPKQQEKWKQDLIQLKVSVQGVVKDIICNPAAFFKRIHELMDSKFCILICNEDTAGGVQDALDARPQWVKDDGFCVVVNMNEDVHASYQHTVQCLLDTPAEGGVSVPYQRRTFNMTHKNQTHGWINDPAPPKATLKDLLTRAGEVQTILDAVVPTLRQVCEAHLQQYSSPAAQHSTAPQPGTAAQQSINTACQQPSDSMILSALVYTVRNSKFPYSTTYAHNLDPLDTGSVGVWLRNALHGGLVLPGGSSLGRHAKAAAKLVKQKAGGGDAFYVGGLPSVFRAVNGASTVAYALLDQLHKQELAEADGGMTVHSGINSSVLIISEALTSTPHHEEDGKMGFANTNFGNPKTWDILLRSASEKFSASVHSDMDWRTKGIYKSATLEEASVYSGQGRTAALVLQCAGQAVVGFAGPLWHQTDSTGPGLAEACNTGIGFDDDKTTFFDRLQLDWDLAHKMQTSKARLSYAIRSWVDAVLLPAATFFPSRYKQWQA